MPAREQARLDALRDYGILDADPEGRYDTLVELAGRALGTPMATLSLVDEDRCWLVAAHGVERGELPRAHSFGAHTITRETPTVVEDASSDPRFAQNQLVHGEAGVRFYAGAPLTTPAGLRVGALCVLDTAVRTLDANALEILAGLASQAVELLEHRLTAARLEHALARLQTMATLIPICSHCRKVRDEEDQWTTLERLVQAKTGSRFTHGICPDCVREHYPDAAEELLSGRR